MNPYIKRLGIAAGICIIGILLQLTFFAIVLALVIYVLILVWKSGILRQSGQETDAITSDNTDPVTNFVVQLRSKLGKKRFNIAFASTIIAVLLIALIITNASQPRTMTYGETQEHFQNIFDEIDRDINGK